MAGNHRNPSVEHILLDEAKTPSSLRSADALQNGSSADLWTPESNLRNRRALREGEAPAEPVGGNLLIQNGPAGASSAHGAGKCNFYQLQVASRTLGSLTPKCPVRRNAAGNFESILPKSGP